MFLIFIEFRDEYNEHFTSYKTIEHDALLVEIVKPIRLLSALA